MNPEKRVHGKCMNDKPLAPHSYGSQIVIRTVTSGKVRYATCAYSVSDTDDQIAFFIPEDRSFSKVTRGTRVSPRRDRELALREELLTGQWELIDNKPNPMPFLVLACPGQWFSVHLKPMGVNGNYIPYYVNFERPLHRTRIGFDTDDLCLDLKLSTSSNAWEVKDLIDYQERIELGMYSVEEQESVDIAKDQVTSLIDNGDKPFDGWWDNWCPEPSWRDFPLPQDWAE